MKLDDLREKLDLSKTSYKIDKRIFRVALGLIGILVILIAFVTDDPRLLIGGSVGMCCPEDTFQGCNNPFFGGCDGDLCLDPVILPGVCVGDHQPSALADHAGLIIILVLVGAFSTNHYLNNRRKKL